MLMTYEKLPESLDAFEALTDLTRPEAVCALLPPALALYLRSPADGLAALEILRGDRPMKPYNRQFLRDRLRAAPWLPYAYFAGAAPENDYTPVPPWRVEVEAAPWAVPGETRVLLTCAGCDHPRPVLLREAKGRFCLWDYSAVLTGVRLPASARPW